MLKMPYFAVVFNVMKGIGSFIASRAITVFISDDVRLRLTVYVTYAVF